MRSYFAHFGVVAVLLGASAVLATSAHAQLSNGSFETPTVPSGGLTTFNAGSSIGAWTVVGQNVLLINSTYNENGITFNAQDGVQSVDLTGVSNTGLTSGIQQNVATTIGQNYLLSFYVGRASSNSPFYQLPSTADLSINGGPRVSFTNSNATFGAINWQQFNSSFTATTATTTIAFFNGTASDSNRFVGLDNVVLSQASSAAPEPGTLALAVLPIAMMFGGKVRKRQAVQSR